MAKIKNKILKILINVIPVIIMITLINFVKNDYLLTGTYILIIIVSLIIRYEKRDFLFLIFGFFIMMLSEYLFISTGVETFNRKTLLGIMPLWLPFLWAYAFIFGKRIINILK